MQRCPDTLSPHAPQFTHLLLVVVLLVVLAALAIVGNVLWVRLPSRLHLRLELGRGLLVVLPSMSRTGSVSMPLPASANAWHSLVVVLEPLCRSERGWRDGVVTRRESFRHTRSPTRRQETPHPRRQGIPLPPQRQLQRFLREPSPVVGSNGKVGTLGNGIATTGDRVA
ncbi:hypothetical protein BC830DRAFT_1145215 [Chytriomyces sp. MP71]|nr:hypothetical protein BC830DRAFT_1145215 [Chytriomyces sp. MP71]